MGAPINSKTRRWVGVGDFLDVLVGVDSSISDHATVANHGEFPESEIFAHHADGVDEQYCVFDYR